MKNVILEKLHAVEQQHSVKILFACESGSRAWGIASPDSDFDVRFFYVHNMDRYLSVEENRDVIELPIDEVLDIKGWELRKALRLLRKSNASLFEWLQSPIVYRAEKDFQEQFSVLLPSYFSARAVMLHYLSMSKSIFHNELSTPEVKLKKYFYVLRTVLASRWIVDKAEVPPIEFQKLRILMPDELQPLVDDLLTVKKSADEKYTIKAIEVLSQYLEEQITYCENRLPERSPINESEPLNKLFRHYIL